MLVGVGDNSRVGIDFGGFWVLGLVVRGGGSLLSCI